jgi:chorismate synthase
MLRFLTAGESHGPSEVGILEGMPAGLPLSHADIQTDLEKRRGGMGRGGRGKIETDTVKILSGVRHGKTLGSPIALVVENADFSNWKDKMSVEANGLGDKKELYVTKPRPGHTDLAGALKYGFGDIRNVLERASARETVMRVALGAVCRKFLLEFGITIGSHTIQIGKIKSEVKPKSYEDLSSLFTSDPDIRCLDEIKRGLMKETILDAIKKKDTLGGVIEICAYGVPVGLGSYVHFDRKLDARLTALLMSIPSVKAVEIGDGVENAEKLGSTTHDAIYFDGTRYFRKTNGAGGIEGGVSNGETIICRVYHKPISTLGNPLDTVDVITKEPAKAHIERSDTCIVPRAGIVSEAAMAFGLAQAMLEKFGGDAMNETFRNYEGFLKSITTL